jgi:hypothetical protein
VVHVLNRSPREAEVGGFLSFMQAWFTEGASGQTNIHSETKTKNNNNKKNHNNKITHSFMVIWGSYGIFVFCFCVFVTF